LYYETVFIVNPDISQENTQSLTDSLVERVEKAAGRIVKREYWGSRPLAYQIAKRKRGHYVLLVTDGEPSAVAALEQALRLEERVLRFLTIRLTELSESPSPLMRRRTEPARTESAEPEEAAESPKEAKPVKAVKKAEAEIEDKAGEKAEDVKAKEKPAKAEAEKAPVKKDATRTAATKKTEEKNAKKSNKADGDADD